MWRNFILGTLLWIGGAFAQSPIAKPYALTCIGNDTELKINYFVRWGAGEWQRVSVAPQKWMWHTWTYTKEASSPELLIRFDADLTQGQTWIVAPLEKYASPSRGQAGDCEKFGRRYQFRRIDKDLLELISLD
ncbi:MAG: hypothetical protein RMK91_09715 [Pseudanabaenaceae cyanobacterium SKYGB_i_bin29]|nr:hypothetical protein [Pseudanabaenaceae cyanobacterium SKYG29]MDW8422129.1 hypothetical protein [Pseudanabaenaceae cyanobacterium SKYGB_i_bin29]